MKYLTFSAIVISLSFSTVAKAVSHNYNSPSLLLQQPNNAPQEALFNGESVQIKNEKTSEPTKKALLLNLIPSSESLRKLTNELDRNRKQVLSNNGVVFINSNNARYASYIQKLTHELEVQWHPPSKNIKPLNENECSVSISLMSNGDLIEAEIIKPSPNQALNDSVLDAVHAAEPFNAFPKNWGFNKIRFNLIFELKSKEREIF